MYLTVNNVKGTVNFNTEQFDTFRGLVAGGQKIHAIKMVREMLPSWGLKECKDFVEDCFFPVTSTVTSTDATKLMLSDLKDDVRSILVSEEQYRNSLLVDLFGRISEERGKLR